MHSLEASKTPGKRSFGIQHIKENLSICQRISFDSEEEVRSQMEVNFYGALRSVRALLPSMRARGSGNIVLISSGAG